MCSLHCTHMYAILDTNLIGIGQQSEAKVVNDWELQELLEN